MDKSTFEVIKMHSKKWGSEGVMKGANCAYAKGVSVGANERLRRLVDLIMRDGAIQSTGAPRVSLH